MDSSVNTSSPHDVFTVWKFKPKQLVYFFISGRYFAQRLYEQCDCKDRCKINNYLASLSRAAFPSQPVLNDIQSKMGFSEKFVRYTCFKHCSFCDVWLVSLKCRRFTLGVSQLYHLEVFLFQLEWSSLLYWMHICLILQR